MELGGNGRLNGERSAGRCHSLALIILDINALLRQVGIRLNRLGAYFSTSAPASFDAIVERQADEQAAVRAGVVERSRKVGLHLRATRTADVDGKPDALCLEFDVIGLGRIEQTVERLLAYLTIVCSFACTRTDAAELDSFLPPSSWRP